MNRAMLLAGLSFVLLYQAGCSELLQVVIHNRTASPVRVVTRDSDVPIRPDNKAKLGWHPFAAEFAVETGDSVFRYDAISIPAKGTPLRQRMFHGNTLRLDFTNDGQLYLHDERVATTQPFVISPVKSR